MPQSILDNLKRLALSNVPKTVPSQQEQENRDLRATAIQGEQSLGSPKSIGRNLFDVVTQGIAGDPFQDDSDDLSWGSKVGMLGAAAPMLPKRLPIIAPEAYKDVKAGGMRLYSRLTDTFAKAPAKMKPAKAISLAQSGAAREEIEVRKLADFLKTKPATPPPAKGMRRLYRFEEPNQPKRTPEELMNEGVEPDIAKDVADTQGRWFGDDYDYVKNEYSNLQPGWSNRQPVYVDVPEGLPLHNELTDGTFGRPGGKEYGEFVVSQQHADMRRPYRHEPTPRNPMEDIDREEIMEYLAANPLELDVARKGQNIKPQPAPEDAPRSVQLEQDMAVLEHELDTRYGGDWNLTNIEHTDRQRWNAINDERQQVLAGGGSFKRPNNEPEYSFMQVPGPSENYHETLIKMPVRRELQDQVRQYDDLLEQQHELTSGLELDMDRPGDLAIRDEIDRIELERKLLKQRIDAEMFKSGHFSNDPNTVVWSRNHDRYLNPDEQWAPELGEGLPQGAQRPVGKGRLTMEIQSDWHQQGRERGYNTQEEYLRREAAKADISDKNSALEAFVDAQLAQRPDLAHTKNFMPSAKRDAIYWSSDTAPETKEEIRRLITDAEAAAANWNKNFSIKPVPDAPYKDTYHELALKQLLLDAADDPSLEWLGVADADTASVMEGHIPHLGDPRKWSGRPGDPGMRPGMEKYYNEKHPSALERLLNPLGGSVGYDNLSGPIIDSAVPSLPRGPLPDTNWGNQPIVDLGSNQQIATALTDDPTKATSFASNAFGDDIGRRQLPGPGMWKANLTPELKALIKERGFPAMSLMLALQQAMFNKDEQ